MEIHFDLPEEYENDMLVISKVSDPSSLLYINVFAKGDVWIKIKGCEDCKNAEQCCRGCAMWSQLGCILHCQNEGRDSNKPYRCIIAPNPRDCQSYCKQEFKCIQGSYLGKIRKVSLPGDIFL